MYRVHPRSISSINLSDHEIPIHLSTSFDPSVMLLSLASKSIEQVRHREPSLLVVNIDDASTSSVEMTEAPRKVYQHRRPKP